MKAGNCSLLSVKSIFWELPLSSRLVYLDTVSRFQIQYEGRGKALEPHASKNKNKNFFFQLPNLRVTVHRKY